MILFPQKPKVASKKDNWVKFEIEGLYPGYGVTVGNSLRRVLISSLQGAAVTQVKIKKANHEFGAVPGVLEDAMMILMNLKQMRFKVHSDEPQRASLKIKGEKEAKGSDFDFPSQVELVNGSCHIATLTDKKAELEIEIQIEKGVGYESIDRRRKKEKPEVGMMPIDSIFTPVKRVNYKVENMRVGERTDFDRLIIEVETDGTISPELAFYQASDILVKHFSILEESFRPEPEVVKEEKVVEKKKTAVKKKKKK